MRTPFLLILLLNIPSYAGEAPTVKNSGAWTSRRQEPVTVSGKVLRTDRLPEGADKEVGANIQLDTAEGVLNVHVGPMWFTNVRDAAPKIGEPMTVVGFRFTFDKKPDVIAKEVTINGKTFTVWEKTDRAVTNEPTERARK